MWHARETTLTLSVMYLSPLTTEVYLLVKLSSKLYVTFILQWIALFGKLVQPNLIFGCVFFFSKIRPLK